VLQWLAAEQGHEGPTHQDAVAPSA
jgi:hypothetical protein